MINLGDDNKKKSGNNRLYEQRVYGTDKQKRDQYDKLMGRTYTKDTRRPVKSSNSHGGVIALMAVFMVLIFGALLYLLFSGNDKNKKPGNTVGETPTTAPTAVVEKGYDYTAVVLAVDTEIKTIKMYDVDEEIERTLVYTGSSLFYAEQGSQVTAGQLKPGDFMLFNCDARQIIKKAQWVSDGWEKLRIDDLEIQKDLHRMIIRGQIYKYSDDLCVISDDKRVNIDALLTGEDKYTIRGIGDTVKEIFVTVGHGVLQLKNYEDFVDGEIMIGSRYTEVVPTSGMFVVREGEYKVVISSGRFEGVADIQVKRGEETILDVYEFGRGSITEGDVNFKIEPFGAKLLINGNETDYLSGPVKLDFGSYFIEIQAEGYETQKTNLTVDTLQKSISIYLTELADTTPTPSPEPIPGGDNTGENTDTGNTTGDDNGETADAGNTNTEGSEMYDISTYGFTIDPDHRVYILGPEGGMAAITNLDTGVTYSIGTIPCDFQKVIGDMQIIVTNGPKAQVFDYNESDDGADCFYDFSGKFE
ncbi:MAG: hypothetical protein MJ124_02720 [Lachnospiraceae bacterium]|nr:hypothetical protein [Lachnospiraceae bacterium]